MRKLAITITLLFVATLTTAQETYYFASGGLDPKIALLGTDNEYTTHGTGIDYLGKIGARIGNKEVSGYIEVYDAIGYRAMGLQLNHVEKLGQFDFLAGLETSIISRKEVYDNGLNVIWQEYLPSFGVNGEVRWNINKTFAVGYFANYKTRPDLVPYGDWNKNELGRAVRLSTYVQLYVKF